MVRFKNRWLLVELIPCAEHGIPSLGLRPSPGSELNGKQIWAALRQSVLTHFGDAGWGAVGYSLTVKYYSPATRVCIIRVGREHVRTAWGAVTLLSSIEGQRILPHVVHVSGTIKHTQLAAIAHNREVVARYRASANVSSTYKDSYDDFLESSTKEIEALQD